MPAAHAVAVDGDRRGQAGGRAVRHPGALPVAVLRPVLDELLDVMEPYGDQIVLVHIEIYQALDRHRTLVPTVTAWHLRASRGSSGSTAPA